MVNLVNDPLNAQHWRRRATETRMAAEEAGDPQAEAAMLSVAQMYDELAARAEARERCKKVTE